MNHSINIYLSIAIACTFFISCQSKEAKSDYSQIKKLEISGAAINMNNEMNETSGLMNLNGTFWTHNDNGNDPYIYQLDVNNGALIKKIELTEVKNNDWEEIANDSTYVYIGDIGNNEGKRKKLRILKLDKSLLQRDTGIIDIEPIKIKFSYPNQPKILLNNGHDFDAEAFLPFKDSIYIFTKNWKSQKSNLYVIPNMEGEWKAKLISNFDVGGLITSATFLENNSKIILLGYNRGKPQRPFIWILSDYNDNDFFSGKKERFNLQFFAQAEAIVNIDDRSVYITSEGQKIVGPKLYLLNLP